MTLRPIVKNPSDILRQKSVEITETELQTNEIQSLIDDLIESMTLENGIGIAAANRCA
jgi:peptide deformylase